MKDRMYSRYFDIGGRLLKISTNNTGLLEGYCCWLKPFLVNKKDYCKEIKIYLFGLEEGRRLPLEIPAGAKCLYLGQTAKYFFYKGLLITDYEEIGKLVINREKELVAGFVYYSLLLKQSWLLQDIFHPVFELLRKKGIYLYHAGTVSFNNRGLLIAGRSGTGKSTLVLHLLANGFQFLSDDRCFLRKTKSGVEIIGFPELVRVYPENVAHIHEFSFLQEKNKKQEKVSFRVEDVYPNCIIRACGLKAILFPCWKPDENSRMEVISPSRALKELLPLTMECFSIKTAKSHFDFNCELVSQIPCAKLYLGKDKSLWHKMIIDFLPG